jgi:hypothetical protein
MEKAISPPPLCYGENRGASPKYRRRSSIRAGSTRLSTAASSPVDASAGKLLYRERINAPGPYFSAPIAAAGRVYTASSEGIVTVFKSGDTLDILAKNDLGEPIFATPAPVANTLYIRSSRHLWAFNAK